jgi:uncharacterized membrane-anchored protein YhcB (DUF1043 family)
MESGRMIYLLVGAGFVVGLLVGTLAAVRLTPRIVARMPYPEQLAFARKVNTIRDRSRA